MRFDPQTTFSWSQPQFIPLSFDTNKNNLIQNGNKISYEQFMAMNNPKINSDQWFSHDNK